MSNLYWIKDKYGKKIKFTPNWAQRQLLEDDHPCQITLKARQLGITTYYSLYLLDHVLWNDFQHCGIIAQTLDDASAIFRDRLKFAFDHLHPAIRVLFRVVGDSAKELRFSHGSSIRVGTSLRGSTLSILHVSEFGKICVKAPDRAQEIITGSLQTVHAGQRIFIESTAEGREGYFYEMTQRAFAQQNSSEPFGPLDFHPFFFSWVDEPSYALPLEKTWEELERGLSQKVLEYFDSLELKGIALTPEQKIWYAKKHEILQEDVHREFPATPAEAFEVSQVGNWYASQIKELYDNGHVTRISYDKSQPVYTAWDLGQADATAIWFFQINRVGEIMVLDYFERSDTSLDELVDILKSKGYTYGCHIWPHDARARDRAGITFEDQARNFNLEGIVLENHGLLDGINLVRTTLSKMWFDGDKCREGLKALANYKKKWNNQTGGFTSQEVHDWASHGAAAIRYLCAGYTKVTPERPMEDDMNALKSYWGSY